MKTSIDCMPCFVRQTLDAGRNARLDDAQQEALLRHVLKEISDMDFSDSPPAAAAKIHAHIRELSGSADPYSAVKERSNAFALGLLPTLKEEVEASSDPFMTALRFAIAGNIIDFGAKSTIDDDTVHNTLQLARDAVLPEENVARLKRAVDEANFILYLGDNAGEIVFDRLFIEQLPEGRVTFAVRGYPAINDATLEDARRVGMEKVARVIDNGAAVPGTVLEECSDAFLEAFDAADLIIAKGQGNYESLSETDAPITFLFMAKCPVVARIADCEVGSFIITNGNR